MNDYSGIFDGILIATRSFGIKMFNLSSEERHGATGGVRSKIRKFNMAGAEPQSTRTPDGLELTDEQSEFALAISISSLLQQFTNVRVRSDFVNGFFSHMPDPTLLDQLDEMHCLLQPRWLEGGFLENLPRCRTSVGHYNLLVKQSEEMMNLINSSKLQLQVMVLLLW